MQFFLMVKRRGRGEGMGTKGRRDKRGEGKEERIEREKSNYSEEARLIVIVLLNLGFSSDSAGRVTAWLLLLLNQIHPFLKHYLFL